MDALSLNPRRRSWWTPLAVFLVAMLSFIIVQLADASRAHAGTYRVQECFVSLPNAPDAVFDSRSVPGSFTDPNGWGTVEWGAGVWTESRTCGSGGGLGAWHNHRQAGTQGQADPQPQSYGDYAQFTVTAPPGARFRRASFQYNHYAFGGYSTTAEVLNSSGGPIATWASGNTGGWVDADTGLISDGRTVRSRVMCVTQADYQCGAFNQVVCQQTTGQPLQCVYMQAWIRQLNLTVEDQGAPQVVNLGGQLAQSGVHRGVDDLSITAADNGGGVREAKVWVNGSLIANPTQSCDAVADLARQVQPCPANATFNVGNVNTEVLPFHEGINDVQVCVSDYANEGSGSNTSAPCQNLAVEVDNTCPASTGTTATSLTAGIGQLGKKHSGEVTVASDEAASIEGTLLGAGGTVAGGTVCIYERLDLPGQERSLVGIAKSHADGGFEFQVPPGPSREFDLAYRYAGQQVEHDQRLMLNSIVQPQLTVSPRKLENGESARFKGAIPGPLADERVVTLQAKAGKKWRTFKQLKTVRDGLFKGKYKFTRTTGTSTYTFRAVVKRQSGYPYLEGHSRKRQVTVRGR